MLNIQNIFENFFEEMYKRKRQPVSKQPAKQERNVKSKMQIKKGKAK